MNISCFLKYKNCLYLLNAQGSTCYYLFNISFNDIYFCVEVADLLNYADDKTLSHTDKNLKSIYEILTYMKLQLTGLQKN